MTAAVKSQSPHSLIDSTIRVVAFDAVGTLIYAEPSVTSAYCRILQDLCGKPVDAAHVRNVLGIRLSERSRQTDLRTNEESERQFWLDLITELVPVPACVGKCFESLYGHFGLAANWRCYNDVAVTLSTLKSSGLQLVLASNFDERLNAVCTGLEELNSISGVIISSEIGWRKPAPEFFDIVCRQTNCRPEEILFVGDDLVNDIHGAVQSGMSAAWIDRNGDTHGALFGSGDKGETVSARRMRTLMELITHVP